MDKVKGEEMTEMIRDMRWLGEALLEKAEGVQAVEKNAERILANVKMLELNISEVKNWGSSPN
jgi:hypothetical protein